MEKYFKRAKDDATTAKNDEKTEHGIDGLILVEDFITAEQEALLVDWIDTQGTWSNALKRRTQQYGARYDYGKRSVEADVPPIPEVFKLVIGEMRAKSLLYDPDQVIVNEYQPGQGIGAHIDHPAKFTDGIASLSLLSPVTMDFTKDAKRVRLVLPRRSLVVLMREARYDWSHGIAAVKTDPVLHTERKRRVSLTFRKQK